MSTFSVLQLMVRVLSQIGIRG